MNTRLDQTFPSNRVYLRELGGSLCGVSEAQNDQHVIQMNEVRGCASGQVQRAASKVVRMIYRPGRPAGYPVIPF